MGGVLMILIAGPYRSGTNDELARIGANVAAMNAMALRVFRAGHLPILGEWVALAREMGKEVFYRFDDIPEAQG